ncbi:MAG: hypothetical protein QOH35_2547, partial [Acidobacteriaceae bacterium]|nr:hypothetical protein [Acidobacteriaceae bacterium]
REAVAALNEDGLAAKSQKDPKVEDKSHNYDRMQ